MAVQRNFRRGRNSMRSSQGRRIFKRNGALKNNFRGKITRTVQHTVPRQRKTDPMGGGNPPMFQPTKTMRRTVRIAPGATQTTITSAEIFNAEASYYGISATTPATVGIVGPARWRSVKVLGLKAYGQLDANLLSINVFSINGPASDSTASSTFNDYANNNDRPVVSVEMPPLQGISLRNANEDIISFTAAQLEVVDFYVEFA